MNFAVLLKKCSAGDRTAFSRFVESYFARAKSIAARRINDESACEDAVQEVFLKFYEKNLFQQFRGNTEEEFQAYFAKVLIHHIYGWYKKTARSDSKLVSIDLSTEEHGKLLLDSNDPLEKTLQKDLEETLNKAVEKLPDNYRDVINLRLLDYTNREIADILNKPLGTIDTWSSRSLSILRDYLNNAKVNLN